MARHLTFTPDASTAGSFPGAISADTPYDLSAVMDQPFDTREGVDPIRYAAQTVDDAASGIPTTTGLTSVGQVAADADLAANEIGVVEDDGYQILVGTAVAQSDVLELEYAERGMIELPL